MRKAHAGGRAIDPAVEAWSEADPLNDRERQVLHLAGDIAAPFTLSHSMVRNHLSEAIGCAWVTASRPNVSMRANAAR